MLPCTLRNNFPCTVLGMILLVEQLIMGVLVTQKVVLLLALFPSDVDFAGLFSSDHH